MWGGFIIGLFSLFMFLVGLNTTVGILENDRDTLRAELKPLKETNKGLSKKIAALEVRISRLEKSKNPMLPR